MSTMIFLNFLNFFQYWIRDREIQEILLTLKSNSHSSFHCFSVSIEEWVSCKNETPLGQILFLKYSNILTRVLEDCNPFTLFVRKLKFNWLLTFFFLFVFMLMIVEIDFGFWIILFLKVLIRENIRFDKNLVYPLNIILFWRKLKVHYLGDKTSKKLYEIKLSSWFNKFYLLPIESLQLYLISL